jgi:hypothetical protein
MVLLKREIELEKVIFGAIYTMYEVSYVPPDSRLEIDSSESKMNTGESNELVDGCKLRKTYSQQGFQGCVFHCQVGFMAEYLQRVTSKPIENDSRRCALARGIWVVGSALIPVKDGHVREQGRDGNSGTHKVSLIPK